MPHSRKFRSLLSSVAVAVVALVGLTACTGSAATSEAAAQVGEVDIPVADLQEQFERRSTGSEAPTQLDDENSTEAETLRAAALTSLIRSEILRQAAEEREVEITDEDLEEQRELLVQQFGGEEALNQQIESANISDEELDDTLRDQAIQAAILSQLADEVDADAIREAYESDPQGRYGEKVEVRHILTEERGEARDAIERIESGDDFAEVASEVSIDPGSVQNGGDLGEVGRNATVPEFEEAAFDAEVGELVGPVESEFGFHVIEVTETVPAPDLAEVEDQIRAELEAQSGGQAFNDFLNGFIADLGIEVDEQFGRWDANAVTVVPPGTPTEAPAAPGVPSDLPLPTDAPS